MIKSEKIEEICMRFHFSLLIENIIKKILRLD
jgi:hypothetical protein